MSFDWATLWKVLLIAGMLLFAGMAVVVSIGGVFDIKRLFARIAESHRQTAEAAEAEHQTSNIER
jgi:hypothetical protein